MARPVVSQIAERLYASMGAFTVGDEDQSWALLNFCDAITEGLGFAAIDEIVSDTDDAPGWQVLFDPENCPAAFLPYLAQFVGVTITPSMTEQERRDAITLPEGFKRGTPAALRQAVQRTLTGSKHVAFQERDPTAYSFTVRTQTSETPSEADALAAILTQKPIGLVVDYDSITGNTFNEIEAAFADFDAITASGRTFSDLLLNPL